MHPFLHKIEWALCQCIPDRIKYLPKTYLACESILKNIELQHTSGPSSFVHELRLWPKFETVG